MRNVAIIGVGQTKHGRLRDVNAAEMVAEAAWRAMEDANVTPDEIDSFVLGTCRDPEGYMTQSYGLQICSEPQNPL